MVSCRKYLMFHKPTVKKASSYKQQQENKITKLSEINSLIDSWTQQTSSGKLFRPHHISCLNGNIPNPEKIPAQLWETFSFCAGSESDRFRHHPLVCSGFLSVPLKLIKGLNESKHLNLRWKKKLQKWLHCCSFCQQDWFFIIFSFSPISGINLNL